MYQSKLYHYKAKEQKVKEFALTVIKYTGQLVLIIVGVATLLAFIAGV